MVPGLYSAASSMRADERNHEIIARNLANAGLPGFRRQVTSIESFGQAFAQASPTHLQMSPGLQANRFETDFSAGDVQHTGRALDVAIRGDGFFVLDGPNGPVYTRNGVFQLNGNGELLTMGGLPVRGSGGRITIPPDTTEFAIRPDGGVSVGANEVGRLEIAHFKNPHQLVRVGNALFQAPPGMRSEPGTSTLHQYYRESSNVNSVDEMVQMIAGMRHYEASQRALRTIAESIQLSTRPQTG
jgi:flagellar basal-body rod protein FlgF